MQRERTGEIHSKLNSGYFGDKSVVREEHEERLHILVHVTLYCLNLLQREFFIV